jgi:hypothetical protein
LKVTAEWCCCSSHYDDHPWLSMCLCQRVTESSKSSWLRAPATKNHSTDQPLIPRNRGAFCICTTGVEEP